MSQDPEVIQKEMEKTRGSLTEKLEKLEGKVSETVTSTTGAVQDTTQAVQSTITGAVDTVKDTVETVTDKVQETVATVTEKVNETMTSMTDKVQETVQAFSDTLSETFSLSVQMERRPWVVLGGAAALGCLIGATLGSSSASASPSEAPASSPPQPFRVLADEPEQEQAGILDGAFSQLKNLGVSYLMGMVRDLARRELPEALGKRIADQVDTLTSKFGSDPIREPLLPETSDTDKTDESRPMPESNPRIRALAGAGAKH